MDEKNVDRDEDGQSLTPTGLKTYGWLSVWCYYDLTQMALFATLGLGF
jgi:hypothetical protein